MTTQTNGMRIAALKSLIDESAKKVIVVDFHWLESSPGGGNLSVELDVDGVRLSFWGCGLAVAAACYYFDAFDKAKTDLVDYAQEQLDLAIDYCQLHPNIRVLV